MTESIKNTVIGGAFTIIGAAIGAYGMYLSSTNSNTKRQLMNWKSF